MALTGSDQITITDIRDSIGCEISSSNGTSLLDASQGTILTCRLYGADGEIDPEIETEEDEENITQDYIYYWTKKETDSSEEEEEFFRTGKSIELTPEDLESSDNNNSFTFYCDVYNIFLEEDGQLVAHGEITLDSTIKKWMNFDESLGLSIQSPGSSWATLTDETGYHIYHNSKNNTFTIPDDFLDINNWIGSFAKNSLITKRIRLLDDDINNIERLTNLSVMPSLTHGWVWTPNKEGDEIFMTTVNNNDIPGFVYKEE